MAHDLDNLNDTMEAVIEAMVTGEGRLDERLERAAELLKQLNILILSEVPGEYQSTLLPIIDRKVGGPGERERLAGDLLRIHDEVRRKVGK